VLSESSAAPHRQVLPGPVFSSRPRAWTGASLDVFRIASLDCVTALPDHLISVQVSGGASLYQRRGRQEVQKQMSQGEVIITPAGEPKVWRRVGEGTVLVIEVNAGFLDGVLEQATGRSGARAELRDNFGIRDAYIERCATAMWEELRDGQLGGRMYAEATITQLAVHLLRHHAGVQVPSEMPQRISSHKLRIAKAYIEENLGADLAVEVIARAAGMSAFHFAHAFSDAVGMPPHRYVMRRRLEMAKALLRETQLPLGQIAQRVGYSSASHFSVGFQKLMQLSPSEYRKAL
jgi:AraC family transcriptional regulator